MNRIIKQCPSSSRAYFFCKAISERSEDDVSEIAYEAETVINFNEEESTGGRSQDPYPKTLVKM